MLSERSIAEYAHYTATSGTPAIELHIKRCSANLQKVQSCLHKYSSIDDIILVRQCSNHMRPGNSLGLQPGASLKSRYCTSAAISEAASRFRAFHLSRTPITRRSADACILYRCLLSSRTPILPLHSLVPRPLRQKATSERSATVRMLVLYMLLDC